MYHYEILGDEKFQQLCQVLITSSFPEAQALPVGQPDGGRDSFVRHQILYNRTAAKHGKELNVFQVKFVKDPNSKTEREMIEALIKSEAPKIERLRARGMKNYFLITNLKGTSHIDAGSIDRVNNLLSEFIGVPSYCWWRDDLDARLNAQPAIKWSFPEILKATDLLDSLMRSELGENSERRMSAIKAYLSSQYDDDQELKFKQTDLRSTMTDLFVDLPMRVTKSNPQRVHRSIRYVGASPRVVYSNAREYIVGFGDNSELAADFILQTALSSVRRIVIEGAPGQGKSTVTQFICQVLRMHLLNKKSDLANIPKSFSGIPIRVPFRVDLRDLAKWISGTNPFVSKATSLPDSEPRSLEGFLAAQVRLTSGGHEFNVSDLTQIARASQILMALDGFDEVADVGLRKQLVEEISRGVNRISNSSERPVMAIVTSRPAAFAKSVIFPRESWSYFELLPLERRQIDDYTKRWTKAKGLKGNEALQLQQTLDVKMQEAHTEYLSKNPMQLTILLSLINSRGSSLPEKRTSMYDAYMDTFFSRESEKSEIVRENREILIDIHRYLAWKLQTAAEGGENGSIEYGALRSELFQYLDREGEDTTIINDLFDGIIERVGALVSRVQGTYEFEVQPLREYFAARHLFETAPYSVSDEHYKGDKFERFKALVSNPYWLNVARFYGGCFTKGELLTLAFELEEMSKSSIFKNTSHPRSVAMMLLSDWVFSAYQHAVKRVVNFIGEYPNLRQLAANPEEVGSSHWSSLPDRSGRQDFLEILWKQIIDSCNSDERFALASILNKNSSVEERIEKWISLIGHVGKEAHAEIGIALKIFSELSLHDVEKRGIHIEISMIRGMLMFDRFDYLERSKYEAEAKALILADVPMPLTTVGPRENVLLYNMASMFNVYQYTLALSDENTTLVDVLSQRFSPYRGGSKRREKIENEQKDARGFTASEEAVISEYNRFIHTDTASLSSSLEHWSLLVEKMRAAWGDQPAIDRVALIAAGIRSSGISGDGGSLSKTDDLVSVARYIRLKSGAYRWWESHLSDEYDPASLKRMLIFLQVWGTPATIWKIRNVVSEALKRLAPDDWQDVTREANHLRVITRQGALGLDHEQANEVANMSSRMCVFLGRRVTPAEQYKLVVALLQSSVELTREETSFCMGAMMEYCTDEGKRGVAIPLIKELYKRGVSTPMVYGYWRDLPLGLAVEVSKDVDLFPLQLVGEADRKLKSQAGSRAVALLDTARSQGWFETKAMSD
ncbi:NACHT domain-containing protein [Jiella mangrovi]|uniref:NACHT domain-containing protein n=1 Tax=Jiella mangrovi TaxID=2821407 RepID=A0ABS4BG12_9HYPH|nr:hypothetical protein [Jiella mangrovi]MBP0615698.1 hypothetical protein [Jiella mangrovi]